MAPPPASCSSAAKRSARDAVISNADPKRTLLKLVDPTHLTPDFVMKLQHYRMPGTVAKVNLALSGLPNFTALRWRHAALSGRIHIGPEIDYLERAFDESKYGNFSQQPYLEIAIPSLTDPSLAPRGQACDVDLHAVRALQAEEQRLGQPAKSARRTVVKTIAQYAPELAGADSEATRSSRRRIWKKPTASPAATSSMANWRSISSSPCVRCWIGRATGRRSRILYLCGSGTHPGAGLTGGSGANAAREILKDLKK